MAASIASAGSSHPLRWFSVRKDAKDHGRRKMIEGDVVAGADALKSARTQLKSLLDHLRWEDSGEPEETLVNPTRATC